MWRENRKKISTEIVENDCLWQGRAKNAISFIKPPITIWLFKLCAHVPLIKIKMEFKECTGRNKWSVTALVLSEKKPLQVFLASPQMAQARTPLYPQLSSHSWARLNDGRHRCRGVTFQKPVTWLFSLQDEWFIEKSNSEHFGLPQTRRDGQGAL